MYRSKYWEVFQQANQGICVYNCKLERIYANEVAKQVLANISPELCKEFMGICRCFVAMVRATKTSLLNYSGSLEHQCVIISFCCFSIYSDKQALIIVVFDYKVSSDNNPRGRVTFTRREKDILNAIATGKTNKEISEMLGIGFETVKSHVRNLLAKTGTSSRTELISKNFHLDNGAVGPPNDTGLRKK
jgi:DNA-binding CsgD family transcriptional regulator